MNGEAYSWPVGGNTLNFGNERSMSSNARSRGKSGLILGADLEDAPSPLLPGVGRSKPSSISLLSVRCVPHATHEMDPSSLPCGGPQGRSCAIFPFCVVTSLIWLSEPAMASKRPVQKGQQCCPRPDVGVGRHSPLAFHRVPFTAIPAFAIGFPSASWPFSRKT